MKKLYIITGIMILILTSSFLYAGIGINPTRVETSAEVGKESAGSFKLTNTAEKPIIVGIGFEDWLNFGVDPSTWIKFDLENFTLQPGETRDIKYVVNLPLGTTGERAIRVLFNGKEEGAFISMGIGVHVYTYAKGTEKLDIEIKELTAKYDARNGVSGILELVNKGNVHIRPITVINILDEGGKSVKVFSVPSDNPVQVGGTRIYNFSNQNITLQPGQYKVIARSDCGNLYGIDYKVFKETELTVGEKLVGEAISETVSEETPLVVKEVTKGESNQ